jgi:hypothetical protein
MQNAILLDAIDTLPERYVPEVLDFIDFLKAKAMQQLSTVKTKPASPVLPKAAHTSKSPLQELQEAMVGAAEQAGWTSPDDIVAYVKQLRRERPLPCA